MFDAAKSQAVRPSAARRTRAAGLPRRPSAAARSDPEGPQHYKQADGSPPADAARSRKTYVGLDELARRLGLERLDPQQREAARKFPVRWPRAYLDLADPADPEDPILAMGMPDPRELRSHPGDLPDAVGEAAGDGPAYLVSKHKDRALLLVSSRCHFYCRFCFRRSFPHGGHRDPTEKELEAALAAIEADTKIEEVILSGGDPLVLEDRQLDAIVKRIGLIFHVRRLRVHTRAPVVLPERLTPELAAILGRAPHCRVVTHFNHPRELTPALTRVVQTLGIHGIPLLNQGVLLKGVNDEPELLAELQRGLAERGCSPYYLHHTDRTPGNAHFRVSLDRGRRLYGRLRELLRQELLPRYVVDLPDGTGKVPVEGLIPVGPQRWRYAHPDGRVSSITEA